MRSAPATVVVSDVRLLANNYNDRKNQKEVATFESARWFYGWAGAPGNRMKALILFVGLCILFVLCWPLAILALILLPVVWLLSLPLRLIGITLEAVFGLIKGVLLLPARLLNLARRDAPR